MAMPLKVVMEIFEHFTFSKPIWQVNKECNDITLRLYVCFLQLSSSARENASKDETK